MLLKPKYIIEKGDVVFSRVHESRSEFGCTHCRIWKWGSSHAVDYCRKTIHGLLYEKSIFDHCLEINFIFKDREIRWAFIDWSYIIT